MWTFINRWEICRVASSERFSHGALAANWVVLLRRAHSSKLSEWQPVREWRAATKKRKMLKFEVFVIVVWKGSLPMMQETERPPCSKNERFSGPRPPPPRVAVSNRSQNISSFRNQGHCIFILIPPPLPTPFPRLLGGSRKWSGSCSSSSGSGLHVLSGPWPDV